MVDRPPPEPMMQRARGIGRIGVKHTLGQTRLATLYQQGCAKIRLPNTHGAGLEAVLINTAGGLTGGDVIDWRAEAAENCRLTLTTPASERVYRSTGELATVRTELLAGRNAHIDWLPQETIVFAQSALKRSLDIHLAQTATLTALEAVLLGRQAMGEDARSARLTDSWRIYRDGRLIHAEATRLGAHPHERDGASTLAGMRAFATIIHISPSAGHLLETTRRFIPDQPGIGTSLIGDKLIVRAMADSGLALRRLIVPILGLLSSERTLPRLWHT